MIASFHNHSIWSDGQSSFGDLYAHAKKIGVDILGLSDHFCIYPDGTFDERMLRLMEVSEYLAELASFREKGGIEIRTDLEIDWFADHLPVILPHIEPLPLDYRIGSVHHVDLEPIDWDASFWSSKSEDERDQVYLKYWRLIREMAESNLFDIAGHLDLPKKFGFYPTAAVAPAIDAALDAIADHHLVVECNTAGYGKVCADSYPSLDILKKCRQRDIPVTLSSDGHIPEHILYEFEKGLARLQEAGFSAIARFRERERWFEPLQAALKNGFSSRL
jgi:histidinol-phosphatase (PHP family)